MLGTLALVPVGQQHRERRALPPFVFGRDEKIVDDDLGAVDEVAELRLPRDEGVGRFDGVAVLKAERGEL